MGKMSLFPSNIEMCLMPKIGIIFELDKGPELYTII